LAAKYLDVLLALKRIRFWAGCGMAAVERSTQESCHSRPVTAHCQFQLRLKIGLSDAAGRKPPSKG